LEATRVGAENAGVSPMSGSSGGGSGRRITLGTPTSKTAQAMAPAASLATFRQRIRDRLHIALYNPGGCDCAPTSVGKHARLRLRSGGPECSAIVARRLSPLREYELVLMLDPEIPEERREQITSEARQRIESGGSLKHDSGWGMRKLAYEIQQRTEADYRFFRFETEGALLDDLNHNLRIADGVLRFRIFKVDPRSPTIVPPPQAAPSATPARGERRPQAAQAREPAAAEGAEPPEDEQVAQAPEAEAEEAPTAPAESEGIEAPAESEGGEAAAEQPAGEASEPTPKQGSEPEAAE
jgi:small subunit ribosomal protein S6